MKSRFCLTLGILNLVALASLSAVAQEPPKPGPQHAVLKEMEGTWAATVKYGTEESKAVSTSKMGLGGLWLVTEFNGDVGGAPFEGRGIDGYDPDKKKYVSVWIDSMSTSPMVFEGTYDEKSKTLTNAGEGKGPDGKPAKFKGVTTFPDRDHQVFKMFLVGPDGKDNLMMTIEYTRKK